MRKTVHLCLSSHDEVMYRNEADLNMGFNCLALAVLETESRLLAEAFMTTHNHKLLQTDNAKEVVTRDRYAYTRYFNAKYYRKGNLGERVCFSSVVDGMHHTVTALNYVLRQGLHHGLAATPFGYPHCSVNSMFRKDFCREEPTMYLLSEKRHIYLPHHKSLPLQYRMLPNGLILRADNLDTAYVEELHMSPRNFLFQMNRITDEKIASEQTEENDLPPVTLETIEQGVPVFNVKDALVNELGRVNKSLLTDLELCHIVDDYYLPRLLKENEPLTIYRLSESKRADLGNLIWQEAAQWKTAARSFSGSTNPFKGRKTDRAQIRRCLAI